jgi:hypothetical protein
VFDALGTDLGLFAGRDLRGTLGWPGLGISVVSPTGILLQILVDSGVLSTQLRRIVFEEPASDGCIGQPYLGYLGAQGFSSSAILGRMLFNGGSTDNPELYVTRSEPAIIGLLFQSYRDGDDWNCLPNTIPDLDTIKFAPVDRVTEADLGITFPVAVPLLIAPEAGP